MNHPGVTVLRRALAAAVQARAEELAELEQRERSNPRTASQPDFGAMLWWQFSGRAHDLASFDPAAPRVSPEGVEAALSILQSLCEQAGAVGWKVHSKPDGRALVLTGDGLTVRATVRERFTRGELQRHTARGTLSVAAKKGTATFVLVIEGLGRTPLETEGSCEAVTERVRNVAFFERMRRRADNARSQAAAEALREADRRRAEAAAEGTRQAAAQERAAAAEEAAQREQLLRDAGAWRNAELIRQYVAHAAAGADPDWCAWALRVADDLDPLVATQGRP